MQVHTAACFNPRTATPEQARQWQERIAGRAGVNERRIGRDPLASKDYAVARVLARTNRHLAHSVAELVEIRASFECVCARAGADPVEPCTCTTIDRVHAAWVAALADQVNGELVRSDALLRELAAACKPAPTKRPGVARGVRSAPKARPKP